ncbi:hypothetical protein PILCRDRAFT_821807 [Piloderma croceum F 1598]|uniref:Uncharacterized protein n=1 Tax=Piloderma croceum (strain F 1598) TaxID=765440 RepID=A0A0C3B3Z9_PILCF|nr:hypothetical protein PILCRDRAFT_821807 [Piloderma croceum F 1598]
MAFAALLERTPPHLRHLRYLFVSSHDPAVEGIDEARARYCLLSDKIERLPKRLGDGSDEEAEDEEEALRVEYECLYDILQSKAKLYNARNKRRGKPKADAFESILRNVASTLEILEVNLDHDTAIHTNENLALPSLTDLITHGAFPLSSTHQLHPPILKPCHSLRRLHVVASSRQVHPTFFLRQHSFAPSLSYLRFSGLQQDGWVAGYVAIALGLVEPAPSGSEVRPLPATIEKILIEPSQPPPPPNGGCGTARLRYSLLLNGCRELHERDKRVVLLRAPTLDEQHPAAPGDESEWLDLVNGGEGCWATHNAEQRGDGP